MRITQQQQCYDAQDALDFGRRFSDVNELQRWVDDLRDTPWWHLQRFSLAVLRIEVFALPKNAKSRGNARYDSGANAGIIGMSLDHLCERVALHEVAHVLADALYDSTGHDPAWAMVFLTLVSCVMGPDAYLTLQRSFDAHGVNYDVAPKSSGAFAL